jgi:hypothetical protein
MTNARLNKNVKPSAQGKHKVARVLNRRHRRALAALIHGPKFREELDRLTGCSNFPECARILRRNGLGHHLQCERVQKVDRDGRRCAPGRYSLTPRGRAIAVKWLTLK